MGRTRGRPNLSSEVVHNVLQDYRKGIPIRKIQAKHNVGENTITRLAKQQGLHVRTPRLTLEEENQLVEAYLRGEKTLVIATEYKIHIQTVRDIAKRHGAPIRKSGRQ